MAKIKAHPETGLLINQVKEGKDGKRYGAIRVDEMVMDASEGFLNTRNRTAFIWGEEDKLKAVTAGLKDGDEFPLKGKIVIKESFEPQYEGHEPKINPSTGEVILLDGKKVYRSSKFTTNMSEQDELCRASVGDSIDAELDNL